MRPEQKKYILDNINKKPVKEIALELGLKERKIKKFLEEEKTKSEKPVAVVETAAPWKINDFWVLLLIAIVGFGLYYNSLNGKFIWDDRHLIQDNTYIKDWRHIREIFTEDMGTGANIKYGFYRPLQLLAYVVVYSIVKLDAKGYHLTSVIFHIFMALSLYWLINILYKEKLFSLLTSLLYIAHPIHTDAVSYISGLSDPMGSFFMLLSIILYIKYLQSKKNALFMTAGIGYVIALLSKESTIIMPGLILLYHYAFKEKVRLKEFFLLSSIGFIYFLLRFTVLVTPQYHLMNPATFSQRLPGFFEALTKYIRLLIAPFRLHIDYGSPIFPYSDPKVLLGMAAVLLSLMRLFIKRNNADLIFFSIVWFFISLIPVANLFYPINFYMTEHWLYVPSIGFFLVLARALIYLCKSKVFRLLGIVFMICLMVFYSCLTINRNVDWREPLQFYEKSLKYAPHSFRMMSDLGLMYYFNGRTKEAMELLERSIKTNPSFVQAYSNLALVYNSNQRYEEAVELCKKAIGISPKDSNTYNNLGQAYDNLGRSEEAAASYEKSLETNPNNTAALSNLGVIYVKINKPDKAIEVLKKAIELKPDFAIAYYNLGNAYIAKKMGKEAIEQYKKAIELKPDYAKAHNNLSATYYEHTKQYDLAIKHCDKAIELGHNVHPDFLKLLEPYRKKQE